jgi:coenzyme F420-reducing hydrogenase delta subunit/ferredoxin
MMWLHLQRLAHAGTVPPRPLAYGLLASLAALAIAKPLASGAPADLARVPRDLPLDWFYLGAHVFADSAGAPALWIAGAGACVALVALGWLSREARTPRPRAAVVDPANCNGCGRCFADCPYLAVTIVARTDARPQARVASVDAHACAGCGICAGACPSSTPFRSIAQLTSGIDLPQAPISVLRAQLDAALARWACAAASGEPRVVAFGCSAALARMGDASTVALVLPCAAQLPPSFVEYALRAGAHGVLVAGCSRGDCTFRLGDRWTADRVAAAREPHLRPIVPRERVMLAWVGEDASELARALAAFRASLACLPSLSTFPPKRTRHAASDAR